MQYTDDHLRSGSIQEGVGLEMSSRYPVLIDGSSQTQSPSNKDAPTPLNQIQAPPHSTLSPSVRTRGPSVLELVVSKTRPPYLPPKSKDEDRKHMADWEDMMRQSRAMDDARETALRERQKARDSKLEALSMQWEREILPDWRVVLQCAPLRKLWWQGLPPKFRPILWPQVIGNQLALSKNSYRTCLAAAQRAISSGSFPTGLLETIDSDIEATLPTLKLFSPQCGPLYPDLRDLLLAWCASRMDEGLTPFVNRASPLAAMFLINLPSTEQAFVSFRNYLERNCPRAFYNGIAGADEREAYYRIFDTLLADYMPKVYFNFKQHQISPVVYLLDWITSAFLDHLPFEICVRIWDVLVLEGDSFLFRVAISIVAVIAGRLYFPDREELLGVLRGENRAAKEVARRTETILDNGKYSIYGVNEITLWQCLDEVGTWWKDSTWTRLLQRELPDV